MVFKIYIYLLFRCMKILQETCVFRVYSKLKYSITYIIHKIDHMYKYNKDLWKILLNFFGHYKKK